MEMGHVWSIVFSGIAIVFIGLVVLILFCTLLSALLGNKKKQAASLPAPKPAAPAAPKPAPVPAAAPAADLSEEDEVIAVIAAAVAAMAEQDGSQYAIHSIRKSSKPARGGRPAWAMAGLQENTQSF